MDIRAVAFDANGTLVKILTEDGMEEIFRAAAHFLTYQGIDLCRDQVRDLYFAIMALNLLRIARNDYIDRDYGGRLASQAKRLLRAA